MSEPFNFKKGNPSSYEIEYNYYRIPLMNIQKNTTHVDNYMSANFVGTVNQPNVKITKTVPEQFQAKRIYVFGRLHQIDGVEYDGEIVIENCSITSADVVYTCFLLKTDPYVFRNNIDEFLQNPIPELHLNLNHFLGNSPNLIVYNSIKGGANGGSARVIVNTDIIPITSNLSGYSWNTTLFDTAAPKKYDVLISANIEGFTVVDANGRPVSNYHVGNTKGDGDIMECDIIDVESDMVTTYNLPIGSDVAKSNSTLTSLTTVVVFVFSVSMSMLVFLISYPIYDLLRSNKMFGKLFVPDPSSYLSFMKINTPFSIRITILFFIIIIILLSTGFSQDNITLITVALYLVIIYVIPYFSVLFFTSFSPASVTSSVPTNMPTIGSTASEQKYGPMTSILTGSMMGYAVIIGAIIWGVAVIMMISSSSQPATKK